MNTSFCRHSLASEQTDRPLALYVYVLRQLLENAKRSKKPLFVAFVDLKAAYVWIPGDA